MAEGLNLKVSRPFAALAHGIESLNDAQRRYH
jgi:hypothetical protein